MECKKKNYNYKKHSDKNRHNHKKYFHECKHKSKEHGCNKDHKIKAIASGYISSLIRDENIKHFSVYEKDRIIAKGDQLILICKCKAELARFYKFACVHSKNLTPDTKFSLNVDDYNSFRLVKPLFFIADNGKVVHKPTGDQHHNFCNENFGDLEFRLEAFYGNNFTSKIIHPLNVILQGNTEPKRLAAIEKYGNKFLESKGLHKKSSINLTAAFDYQGAITQYNSSTWSANFTVKPNGNTGWQDNDYLYTDGQIGTVEAICIKYIDALVRGPSWNCLAFKPQKRLCNYVNNDFNSNDVPFSNGQINLAHFFDPNSINIGDGDQIPPDPDSNHITVSAVLSPKSGSTCFPNVCQKDETYSGNEDNVFGTFFYGSGMVIDPRAQNATSGDDSTLTDSSYVYSFTTGNDCNTSHKRKPFKAVWNFVKHQVEEEIKEEIKDTILEAVEDAVGEITAEEVVDVLIICAM